jgi:hypothetical protein
MGNSQLCFAIYEIYWIWQKKYFLWKLKKKIAVGFSVTVHKKTPSEKDVFIKNGGYGFH